MLLYTFVEIILNEYIIIVFVLISERKMWIFIVCFLGLIGLLMYKYGVFDSTQIYQDELIHPHFLYESFRGTFMEIGKRFDYIESCYKDHFKISSYFGIYYTSPLDGQCKAVLGILVNQGQSNKVQGFQKMHHFNEKRIASTKYLGSNFAYINFLSHYLIKLKVVPQFLKLVREKKHKPFNGIIEIYHFVSESNKRIELVNPLENAESFMLFGEK